MARLETLACHLVPAWLATSDWVEQSLNNVVGEPVLARVQGQSLADSEHTTAPLGRLLEEKNQALRSSVTRWARTNRNVLLDLDLNVCGSWCANAAAKWTMDLHFAAKHSDAQAGPGKLRYTDSSGRVMQDKSWTALMGCFSKP